MSIYKRLWSICLHVSDLLRGTSNKRYISSLICLFLTLPLSLFLFTFVSQTLSATCLVRCSDKKNLVYFKIRLLKLSQQARWYQWWYFILKIWQYISRFSCSLGLFFLFSFFFSIYLFIFFFLLKFIQTPVLTKSHITTHGSVLLRQIEKKNVFP